MDTQAHDIAGRHWPAVRRLPSVPSGIKATITAVVRRGWLLVATLAFVLAASWTAHSGSSYLAVWSSDKETDRTGCPQYGLSRRHRCRSKIPNLRQGREHPSLQSVPGENLLNDLGLTGVLDLTTEYGLPATGIPSDALNEAHHMSHDPIVNGRDRYLYMGGLISANIFRCESTTPFLSLVTTAKDVKNFSGVDDFLQAPNGKLPVTYMGAKT